MFSTVQLNFLLYSAFSFVSALLIGALFWKKEDRSSKLWLSGCLISSCAASVTVFRSEIPIVISYSLMVSLELASVILFSEALKSLSENKLKLKTSRIFIYFPLFYFLLVEFARIKSNGQITPVISAISTFLFGVANLLCLYQINEVKKEFKNKIFFNFFTFVFIFITCAYFIRSMNAMAINNGNAFLDETLNIVIWFMVLFFGTIRNLTYIVLRLQLGFTEHSRLNNMNLMLTNMLEERNEMIQSLERLNKSASLNTLATSIAHEINQPLAASRLFADLAVNNLDIDPQNVALHKETVLDILGEIERAAAIVKNLSNLNSVKERAATIVVLLDSITDVIKISKIKLHDLNINIEINCLPEYSIQIGMGAWQQVLMNTLNNAIDALACMPYADKKIIISVRKSNNFHEISVQDNGIGIPLGQEINIFNLAMTTKNNGSGIGLWLSKNIIESYGGQISAKNNVDGGAFVLIKI